MEKSKLVQITRSSKIAEEDFQPFTNAMYEQVWENLFPPQILTNDLSFTVADNIITPADAPIPDCMTCGGCCAAFVNINVKPDNPIASKDCWEVTKATKNGEIVTDRFIKRKETDFSCVGLEGKIGENVSCRLYENRPRSCRAFEAGSDRCHAVRRAYGIEPYMDVLEMYKATQKLEANESASKPELIVSAKIVESDENEDLQISVTLKNGSKKTVHEYNPNTETWYESEFEDITLAQAEDLIIERTRKS